MDRPYTVEGGSTPGSKNDRPDLRKAVSRDATASGERVGYEDKEEGIDMKQRLIVTMPDGSRWGVPVIEIAKNRAREYAAEFDGDVERSLAEDTIPLFDDEFEIIDWAQNNMNWSDIQAHAERLAESEPADYQEGWVNGEKELI